MDKASRRPERCIEKIMPWSRDEAGNLSLDFSLDISPFHIEPDNNPVSVENDTVEAGLLSGHILYFLGEKQSDGNTIKYTWIKDGKFQIEIQNAEKDTKYNYSIY